MFVRKSVMIGGRPLTVEAGPFANDAVLVTYGGSVVLVTAVATRDRRGFDSFPLTCEYVDGTGNWAPSAAEAASCRLLDRTLRPLFPAYPLAHTNVSATVMSADGENQTDVLAISAASAALHLSDIPGHGPIAGMRVARVDGQLIALPTFEQSARAEFELVVAANTYALVMVEGGSDEVSEAEIMDALLFARAEAQKIVAVIAELHAAVGKRKHVPSGSPRCLRSSFASLGR
jgi:polyribonucleotide nucleotidyltransferase